MFRLSAKHLITAADAASFFKTKVPSAMAADTPSQRQSLIPTTMEIILDHTKDATLVSEAASLLTQIDQEAGDSFAIAQHSECLRVLVAVLMKQQVHNVQIKEHCCRAIANVCMLPNDTFDILNGHSNSTTQGNDHQPKNDSNQQSSTHPKSFADVAVDLGAIELVVGTMSQVSRLSEKGRCWVATALQNLLMFATTPSATLKAGKAGVEDVLATFLAELCHEATSAMSEIQSELRKSGGKNVESEEIISLTTTLQRLLIAIEATMVSLARMMNAPAEENIKSIDVRAQMASANVIDSTVRGMTIALGITTVLTKIQSGDLAGVVFSNPQLIKVRDEAVLPIIHKGWEVLKAIASHKNNLPVIFNAIAEANSDFESLFARNEMWLRAVTMSTSPSSSGGNSANITSAHKQSVNHILEILVNHAMINVSTNLAAIPSEGSNIPRLAFDAALTTITDIIAPRTDVSANENKEENEGSPQTNATSTEETNAQNDNNIPMAQVVDNHSYGNENAILSRSVPTENAATAIGCISTGIPSNIAVTALPRLWQSLVRMTSQETSSSLSLISGSKKLTDEDKAKLQTQYETVHDACGYYGLLANLADAGDTIASSPNAVAVAAQTVTDYLQVAQSALFKLASDKTFLAATAGTSTEAPAVVLTNNLEKSHPQIVAIQRLLVPVVGKAFTLIWNAVGTPQGAEAIKTLQLSSTVQQLNKNSSMLIETLQKKLNELVALQLEALNKESSDKSSATTPPAVPCAVIDSLRELERVGTQLYSKLDAIVVNPVYAQNKHVKK